MVARARGRHHLDTKGSYVIGDKDSDMLLARAVGATGVLVTTGQHASSPHADLVAANLGDAVRSILAREDAA
jgi:histidinol phosphatase-like enzyme